MKIDLVQQHGNHGNDAGHSAPPLSTPPPYDSDHARGHVPATEHPAFFGQSEFSKLRDEAKLELARVSRYRLYDSSHFIYLQDDDAEHLHFVRSGHVRLSYIMEDGSAVLFGILPCGESFGELGVFEASSYCDMATAVGTVSIVSIPARTFRSIAERYPELNVALGRVVARRFRSYLELTRSLGLKTLPARLSQALLRLADGLRTSTLHKGQKVPCIGSFVTQADLGLMARGARGNVNRALKVWERLGWISIKERRILILDRHRLEGLALEEGL